LGTAPPTKPAADATAGPRPAGPKARRKAASLVIAAMTDPKL
jgi:hypothetical protein